MLSYFQRQHSNSKICLEYSDHNTEHRIFDLKQSGRAAQGALAGLAINEKATCEWSQASKSTIYFERKCVEQVREKPKRN